MQNKFLAFFLLGLLAAIPAQARSSKNMSAGIMAMGNIQLVETVTDFAPGPGGGLYFDYRFNQRFSLTVDTWATTHDGTGRSRGDNGIILFGLPSTTLKFYVLDDENSRWDPYFGIGISVLALTEGSVGNGTSGLGLGGQIDVGFDYYLSDSFSVGFDGIFRSVGVINSLTSSATNTSAIIPFSLVAKGGYHF